MTETPKTYYAFYDAKEGVIHIAPHGSCYRDIGTDNIPRAAKEMRSMMAAEMITHGVLKDIYGNLWNEQQHRTDIESLSKSPQNS
jgi:hypothetical protein